MVNMQQFDVHLAQMMDSGHNYMAVAFVMQLVQRSVSCSPTTGVTSHSMLPLVISAAVACVVSKIEE